MDYYNILNGPEYAFLGTNEHLGKHVILLGLAGSYFYGTNKRGYAEQSGHGVPTIVGKYGRDVFSFEDGMVKVSIPLAFERDDVAERKKSIWNFET